MLKIGKLLSCIILFTSLFSASLLLAQETEMNVNEEANISAETEAVMIPYIAYWRVGDSYNYHLSKVNKRYLNGEVVRSDSIYSYANFSVIDSTATSYKIKWSYDQDLSTSYSLSPSLLDKLKKYTKVEIIYQTTEMGKFVKILNWEELSRIQNEVLSLVIEELVVGENKDVMESALNQLKELYSSEDGITYFLAKELHTFHYPFGLQFDVSKKSSFESELPNALGGDPIKTTFLRYFDHVDMENSRCVMYVTENINESDGKKAIKNYLTSAGLTGIKFEDAFNTAELGIGDFSVYDFFFNPGLPIYLDTERITNITMAGTQSFQSERLILELDL